MAAAAGIWTHHPSAPQLGSVAHPAPLTGPANPSPSPSDPSGDGATISANDFLTLLVTEMQNQDPTADTDPNEYIDQLVQVNSLEQLIDINQNLSTALGGSSASAAQSASSPQVNSAAAGLAPSTSTGAPSIVHPAAHPGSALGQLQSAAAAAASHSPDATHTAAAGKLAPGNLGVPQATAASSRVAHALGGHLHPQ
jgi:flagellar basal-body rod modification protein FlgD